MQQFNQKYNQETLQTFKSNFDFTFKNNKSPKNLDLNQSPIEFEKSFFSILNFNSIKRKTIGNFSKNTIFYRNFCQLLNKKIDNKKSKNRTLYLNINLNFHMDPISFKTILQSLVADNPTIIKFVKLDPFLQSIISQPISNVSKRQPKKKSQPKKKYRRNFMYPKNN